jgi:SPOR domain
MIGGRTRKLRGAAFALAVLAACGADPDFNAASRANTQPGWEAYLRSHPDGRHAAEARARLEELREAGDWRKAQALATEAGYQQYLGDHPQGAHAHDALVAIASLNLATPAPAQAAAAPVVAAPRPPAAPAQPPVASANAVRAAFRVQLGAFSGSAAAASGYWRRLLAKHSELSNFQPSIDAGSAADGRPVHRLQVVGLERDAAESLCRELTGWGSPCVVVAPKKEGQKLTRSVKAPADTDREATPNN